MWSDTVHHGLAVGDGFAHELLPHLRRDDLLADKLGVTIEVLAHQDALHASSVALSEC